MTLKQRLIKGAIGSFGIKVVSTGLAFFLNLIIARSMGSEGLGVYALAISWLGLLGLLAKLGFPQFLVRNVSVYVSQEQWPLLRGLLLRAYQMTASFSVLLAVVVAACIYHFKGDAPVFSVLLLALVALPLGAIRKLNQSVMNGFDEVVKSQIPESVVAPILMVCLTVVSYRVLGGKVTPFAMMGFYVGTLGITAFLGLYQVSRILPATLFETGPEWMTQKWLRGALPFIVFGALAMVNTQTDVIMLGAIQGSESVGIYVVANRLASLIIFVLVTSDAVLSPSIASFYAAGNLRQLKRMVTQSSRWVLLFSILLATFIVVFRYPLLGLFGPSFLAGSSVLTILAVGQTVNAFVGPCGPLLNMTGYERLSILAFAVSSTANIALNFYLIPIYDIEGAAIATTVSMILWNVISWALVMKHLGINSTAMGRIKL